MIYPLELKHPHPKYSNCDRLIISNINDFQLNKMYEENRGIMVDIGGVEYERNPFDFIKVKDIKCKCDTKILYEQLFGDITDQQNEVMAYKSCKHTIYAAAKRQMKMAPTPDPKVADHFLDYAKKIIEAEVGEDLTHFGYSYQQWYDHLDKVKQDDMDLVNQYFNKNTTNLTPAQIRKIERLNYEGICKVELQNIDGKPRMVCSIPLQTKFIMGPVCWRLEEIFQDKFRGYCGGKNLTQMAEMVNHYAALGFTQVVEGDGSAFDNTQDITLKRVDHYIYQRIKDKIYHVNKNRFIKIATEPYKTMDVVAMDPNSKKKKLLFTYSILGSVFSGDADTTLCNTIRMALYNRYVNDMAGLVYGKDYVAFSKGDDFTVMYKPYVKRDFIEKAYYKYFVKAIKDVTQPDSRVYGLGQVLKMLDFGDISSLKFCSLRAWYKNSNEIYLTRDPSKFFSLSKYSRKIKTYNNYHAAIYCLQQAEALIVNYAGITIFETMAEAYMMKAKQFIKHASAKDQKSYNKKMDKMNKRMKNIMKKKISPHAMQEDAIQTLVFDISKRNKSYKITGNYWETMQKLEKQNTILPTKDEAALINQQIEAEFMVEELKSVLGLKINEH
jgi:hypothetical protein